MTTVYFIRQIGDETQVKIGMTENLDVRLKQIGSALPDGIELIAQCEGGRETEAAFHALFADDWIEGEWYRLSNFMERFIETFKSEVKGRRIYGRLKAVENIERSPIETDREIIRDELQKLMGRFGAVQFGIAQSRCYDVLHAINPMWSRRRIRSIWERRVRRIDLFELRDLQKANQLTTAEFEAVQSEAAHVLRCMDRARTPGE